MIQQNFKDGYVQDVKKLIHQTQNNAHASKQKIHPKILGNFCLSNLAVAGYSCFLISVMAILLVVFIKTGKKRD